MKRIIIISGIIAVIVFLVLLKVSKSKENAQTTKVNLVNTDIPADMYLVRDTTIEYQLITVGTVKANESVDIVSEINKKIVNLYMKDGAYVNKGELLFKLDDEDIVSKLEKLYINEKLAAATESREKARLSKGGISQQAYDQVLNQLESIRAEIKILKVDLSKTEIRAPFSGRLGLRNISVGAYVNSNTVLAHLQDMGKVKIDFAVPEKYADDVKPGKIIYFSSDYSTDNFKGIIEASDPQIDLKTRSIIIRAVADNSKGILVAGSSIKVHLNLIEMNNSIFVPTEALLPSIEGYKVFVYQNGKSKMTLVKTGIRTKEFVQITEGLKFGDTLITTNLLRIKPGSPVKISKIG